MTTVRPAKTTARAGGADGPAGGLLAGRGRSSELGAVAGDDEQRVVDADREAEHQRQDRRGGAEVDEAGERA